MNIFISYCHEDEAMAIELYNLINDTHKIPCFRDNTDILHGKDIHEAIKTALNRATHLLVILSNDSVVSPWVSYEIGMAEGKQVSILPFIAEPSVALPMYLSHIKCLRNIDELQRYLRSVTEPPSTAFTFAGWSAWGQLQAKITEDMPNEVTMNGTFFHAAAGYVIEGRLPYKGKTLVLEVTGTKRCDFVQQQFFKVQVNNTALRAIDSPPNHNDPDYQNARDGVFKFALPEELKKMEIVFWNATLRDLVIKCRMDDK